MATRNRRHRATASNSLLDTVPLSNAGSSRYDMNLSQNWSVAQLRAELEKNNVPFRKADKKVRLIQLCRESGLISQQERTELQSGQSELSGNTDITKLSATVADL